MELYPEEITVLESSLASSGFKDYDHYLLRERIIEEAYRRLGQTTPFVQVYIVADRILALSAKPRFHRLLGSLPVQNSKTLILTLEAATTLTKAGFNRARTLAKEVAVKLVESHLKEENEDCAYLSIPFKHCYSITNGIPCYMTERDPDLHLTAMGGKALLRYSEIDNSFLKYAVKMGNFLKLAKCRAEVRSQPFFKYFVGGETLLVHNINTLAGSFLLKLAERTKDEECLEMGRSALFNSTSEIASNGSLAYFSSKDARYSPNTIDNFHTGFVICDLLDSSEASPESPFMSYAIRMTRFYSKMFDKTGVPSFTPWRRYPIDIHNYAVGMITFCRLADFDSRYIQIAKLIRESAAKKMRDRDGLYWFQRYPLVVHKGKFLRWNEAWMLRGISECLVRERMLGYTAPPAEQRNRR
jgi:hypothetical protein